MYKALIDIGDFKKGDAVPKDKAEIWLKMYKVPPVEKVDGKNIVKEDVKPSEDESFDDDEMLDDYLNRNQKVVKKNIEKDDLSEDTLEKLLKMEKSDKNRKIVIKAIEDKL